VVFQSKAENERKDALLLEFRYGILHVLFVSACFESQEIFFSRNSRESIRGMKKTRILQEIRERRVLRAEG